jgi:hypothetical protein
MGFLYGDPSAINQMEFLYENPSAINQMRFLYGNLPAINIAHSYGIFIWGSPGYQYCSSIWNFYIGISQLSILLTHMGFLYENPPAIKIIGGHSIIDEHETR